jgi:hypothetical protein
MRCGSGGVSVPRLTLPGGRIGRFDVRTPSSYVGRYRDMSGYVEISRYIPSRPQLTCFYKLRTPLHAGNFEQPQNSWPTFFPDFALRFRMAAPHSGHAGACSRLAMTSRFLLRLRFGKRLLHYSRIRNGPLASSGQTAGRQDRSSGSGIAGRTAVSQAAQGWPESTNPARNAARFHRICPC